MSSTPEMKRNFKEMFVNFFVYIILSGEFELAKALKINNQFLQMSQQEPPRFYQSKLNSKNVLHITCPFRADTSIAN